VTQHDVHGIGSSSLRVDIVAAIRALTVAAGVDLAECSLDEFQARERIWATCSGR
jgi:hypothetical protein